MSVKPTQITGIKPIDDVINSAVKTVNDTIESVQSNVSEVVKTVKDTASLFVPAKPIQKVFKQYAKRVNTYESIQIYSPRYGNCVGQAILDKLSGSADLAHDRRIMETIEGKLNIDLDKARNADGSINLDTLQKMLLDTKFKDSIKRATTTFDERAIDVLQRAITE